MPSFGPSGGPLSEERVLDARFTYANERTFLAWNRTALALIAGGLAIAQLLDFRFAAARAVAAVPLLVLGAALSVASYRRWIACERAMHAGLPLPPSELPRTLVIGLIVVAFGAATAVAIDLTSA